jgi:hypothetical protein
VGAPVGLAVRNIRRKDLYLQCCNFITQLFIKAHRYRIGFFFGSAASNQIFLPINLPPFLFLGHLVSGMRRAKGYNIFRGQIASDIAIRLEKK